MCTLFRFCFLLFVLVIHSSLIFSQEKPIIKLPHEELIKQTLPHEIEGEESSQTRVISNHYYTPDGFEISEYLYQNWSGTAWENSSKDTYTFNTFGNVEEELSQTWDGAVWINDYLSTYSYNSNNLQSEYLGQTWDGAMWVNSVRGFYNYNSNNLVSEYIGQDWDGTVWLNSYR